MTFAHARPCRKKPPLRFERMPFIPRLESLGFSGIAYKSNLNTGILFLSNPDSEAKGRGLPKLGLRIIPLP